MTSTVCIIQARISSTRLPGKIALDLYGKPLLVRVFEQCIAANCEDMDIILATSTDERDNITCAIAKRYNIPVYRGSLKDVRSRYIDISKGYKNIIRVTADNPFTEPSFIVETLDSLKKSKGDYVAPDRCPYGTGVQGFTTELLLSCAKQYCCDNEQREHVVLEEKIMSETDFNCVKFSIDQNIRRPDIRLTVDTFQDYILANTIIEYLMNKNKENRLVNVLPY